jgi:DNA-binding NarL/FixJ family response regulator
MSSPKIRILLADDHTVVREGLKTLIHAQPDMTVIGEAADGRGVLVEAAKLNPDVVVIDISMPEINGAEATRRLKQAYPQMKVLALTVHEDRSYLEQLLGAGASGYVLKRAAADELITALRRVANGATYLDPHVAGTVVAGFVQQHRPSLSSRAQPLTERELVVAKLIAQGYTNKEIAAQLELSVKTIESHKMHSMEKLGVRSRAELVRFAYAEGWLDSVNETKGIP